MAILSQREANRQINKLKKPDEMRLSMWLMVQALLKELVRYLPDSYPSQRRLAERLGISLMATNRLVKRTEAHGFIRRQERFRPDSRWAGTVYELVLPVPVPCTTSGTKEEVLSPKGITQKSSTTSRTVRFAPEAPGHWSRRRHPSARANRYDGYCEICTYPVKAFDGVLHGRSPRHSECRSGQPDWPRLKEYLVNKFPEQDPRTWGTAFGEDPEAPLPTYGPPPAKPQARLAKHFEARWNEALVKRRDWRGLYRGIDLGPAIGYLKSKMLDAGYNDEHITLMIDEFFIDLLDPEGTLMMKDGQTCWQLFTGWWGRNPVPDPVPIRRERERLDALNEAVADLIKATAKPAPPPPIRRVLT